MHVRRYLRRNSLRLQVLSFPVFNQVLTCVETLNELGGHSFNSSHRLAQQMLSQRAQQIHIQPKACDLLDKGMPSTLEFLEAEEAYGGDGKVSSEGKYCCNNPSNKYSSHSSLCFHDKSS